jgi:hypothetical protein
MRLGFNIGRRFGGLTSEQRRVLERLRKREITVEEAERLLGGHVEVRERRVTLGAAAESDPATDDVPSEPVDETPEERAARELVERIAREVDAESAG